MTGQAGSGPWVALDALVAAAVSPGSTPTQVVDRVRSQRGVRRATLRGGLVKTEPPIVELLVEYGPGSGQQAMRVYDLTLHPDGTVTWAGSHPP
jgi:hypothetical protein